MPTLTGGMTLTGDGMLFNPPPPYVPPTLLVMGNMSYDDPLLSGGGANAGRVYTTSTTGTNLASITSSDLATGDYFGRSVAVYGDYILVGASNKKAAYLFDKSGTQLLKIAGPNGTGSNTSFGHCVGMNANYLFVGDRNIDSKGAIYRYALDGTGETKIQVGSSTNQFGETFAVSDNYVLIGTRYDSVAWVYTITASHPTPASNLVQLQPISGSNPGSFSFGASVAISESLGKFAVGDPSYLYMNSPSFVFKGQVHVFDINGSNDYLLRPSDTGGNCGSSVSFNSTKLFAGANSRWNGTVRQGGAYSWTIGSTSGTNENVITASGVSASTEISFGSEIAATDDVLAVGASSARYPGTGTQSGGVYLMNTDGSSQTLVTPIDANDSIGQLHEMDLG